MGIFTPMINLLFGMMRALDCRCWSSVDDGIDASVGNFLGVGRMANSLRGHGVGDCSPTSFDSSRTILNNE